jgi:uncharacterized heparinase superfamily protein
LRIALYFHTLRYLKVKQIWFQILYRIYKPTQKSIARTVDLRSHDAVVFDVIKKRTSLIGARQFKFYGESGNLTEIGWDGLGKDKLWRYNQHYFDDLTARDAYKRLVWHKHLLEDWVSKNQLGKGVGWDPYPISLRIVNWIKWDLNSGDLSVRCRESLFEQCLTLESRLEYHILGNHLFANAKALVFFGCYFEGPESARLLRKGLSLMAKELDIQVLNDGGNFELSPMYHCIFLEDILDLFNVLTTYRPKGCKSAISSLKSVIPSMLVWMKQMCFEDGRVTCFNDSATNIASAPADIISYAKRLGFYDKDIPIAKGVQYKHLADTGYISITRDDLKLVLDVANLGPDYLLAHAHADTLSFELSVNTQRIIVNSGTSCYGSGARRGFERSTRAHNTVEIDDCSSSEVWSTFRVARRARPFGLIIDNSEERLSVECSHDGYTRLTGAPVHTRNWMIGPEKVVIKDKVTGGFASAVSRIIFHADVIIDKKDERTFILVAPNDINLTLKVVSGISTLVAWENTNEFGCLNDTYCLEISLVDGSCLVEIF